jgi:hypothetical protein
VRDDAPDDDCHGTGVKQSNRPLSATAASLHAIATSNQS